MRFTSHKWRRRFRSNCNAVYFLKQYYLFLIETLIRLILNKRK
ncbi:hypothetical protein HMPREF1589_02271 [Escherichia coli 113290]|nr:hypothetical protein HMPREF1589_02271 [Escherichia coli 113290]